VHLSVILEHMSVILEHLSVILEHLSVILENLSVILEHLSVFFYSIFCGALFVFLCFFHLVIVLSSTYVDQLPSA